MSRALTCSATKGDGSSCGGRARPGSIYCLFHDPAAAKSQREAKSEGGRQRSSPRATIPVESEDLRLVRPRDVPPLLADTINRVRKGELDPRIANTIGYLAGVLLRSIEVSELEDRIRLLESAAGRLEPPSGSDMVPLLPPRKETQQ